MQTFKFSVKAIILLSLSLSFPFLLHGQQKPPQKEKSNIGKFNQKLNPNVIKADKTILLQKKTIPEFKNIQPIDIDMNQKLDPSIAGNVDVSRFNAVETIPARDFEIRPASVNGTLTPRDPYLNRSAYLEILGGDVLPAENKANCKCGKSGLTFVKLVLNATGGKKYLVTVNASPKSEPFGLDLWSGTYVHRAYVRENNSDVDLVLSPSANGKIELWMQCRNPNQGQYPWVFNSMKIREVE